jgi:hypothetical protein
MTNFRDTDEAATFIATAASRDTSIEVMRAIAFFARDLTEAEAIWDGDAIDIACTMQDLWENATSNGAKNVDLCWGDAGEAWADDFAV